MSDLEGMAWDYAKNYLHAQEWCNLISRDFNLTKEQNDQLLREYVVIKKQAWKDGATSERAKIIAEIREKLNNKSCNFPGSYSECIHIDDLEQILNEVEKEILK